MHQVGFSLHGCIKVHSHQNIKVKKSVNFLFSPLKKGATFLGLQ